MFPDDRHNSFVNLQYTSEPFSRETFPEFDQGEAIWEKPPELLPKAGTGNAAPHFDNPEEWVCFLDETSGEEYWFNLTTGETHWDASWNRDSY